MEEKKSWVNESTSFTKLCSTCLFLTVLGSCWWRTTSIRSKPGQEGREERKRGSIKWPALSRCSWFFRQSSYVTRTYPWMYAAVRALPSAVRAPTCGRRIQILHFFRLAHPNCTHLLLLHSSGIIKLLAVGNCRFMRGSLPSGATISSNVKACVGTCAGFRWVWQLWLIHFW